MVRNLAVPADKLVRIYVDKSKVKAGAAKSEDSVYPITMIVLVAPTKPGEDEFQPVPLKCCAEFKYPAWVRSEA